MSVGKATLPLVAAAGALLGAGAMWAADRGQPSGDIGTEVRAYLLANPEVIPEAMAKLQDRETGKQVAPIRDAIVRPYRGAWAGNPKGDVTVVEYFDYNCGYCRSSLPVIQQLIDRDPQVRVVFRELPILSETSRAAAGVSLAAAAAGPNQYRRFNTALFAAGPVSPATIASAAAAAGIDPARVPADADAEIRRNLEVAGTLSLSGTPSWVVGNRVLSGAQPLDALEAAVKAARAK
ncbi:MAG: disulfide bond formation protein DsbA [Sphingomonas bacterium]|uniref:DsbA family protein n=1 Tax=Sphingomonas bacterium TaxID=1895847 RepID=UPI00260F8D5F|nr:DsbA family protein [Sphingomonas bacterium]MDB5694702.1 disulfide bond formation protein DsbA [Sphingomonas bacterium]